MKKIIMFGGAFNPPLNSHFMLAQQIVNECENIDKVIFIPVNNKYQKNETVISGEDRYNMLKLVCDKNENFEVSRVEIDADRPLYTIETLDILQEKYPEHEILFATGTDNLKEFDTWYGADKIIEKYKVLVITRDTDQVEDIIASNSFLNTNRDTFIKLKENTRTNLSSTFVRKKIREGKSIRYLTPDEVYNYIKENKLYEVK